MKTAERKRGSGSRKKTLGYLLFLLPGTIYLIINNYVPILGMFIAFKNIDYSKGIFKSDCIRKFPNVRNGRKYRKPVDGEYSL